MRKRPQQARARASAQALQEAFVRVLIERGYANTTIREVASVAGVGIGTFYDYFGNLHALAAMCISETVKEAERAARRAVQSRRGCTTQEIVDAMLDQQLSHIMKNLPAWTALFLLERQLSTQRAFRRHYESWLAMWRETLESASDPLPPEHIASAARMAHVITYGWISQCLLTMDPPIQEHRLRMDLGLAVQSYLRSLA
ncbi:TetR/AcrR family transcriptional regulator [Comamonas composti]|uniref:TetR/AcrR family transcriptional regulator n=1 Tax=Comamonas composti TaxID=408558 RepID=UPI0003FE6923|nr:TetR/AcrR family transcriptional regulator [Comamonas composti]